MLRVLRQRESRSRLGHSRDLPKGSLTLAVALSMRVTGWWLKRWNQERTMRLRRFPRWRDCAVGSKPQ